MGAAKKQGVTLAAPHAAVIVQAKGTFLDIVARAR